MRDQRLMRLLPERLLPRISGTHGQTWKELRALLMTPVVQARRHLPAHFLVTCKAPYCSAGSSASLSWSTKHHLQPSPLVQPPDRLQTSEKGGRPVAQMTPAGGKMVTTPCALPCDARSASAELGAAAAEPALLCCEARASDASAACVTPPVGCRDARPAWAPPCDTRRASAEPGAPSTEPVPYCCEARPSGASVACATPPVARELVQRQGLCRALSGWTHGREVRQL